MRNPLIVLLCLALAACLPDRKSTADLNEALALTQDASADAVSPDTAAPDGGTTCGNGTIQAGESCDQGTGGNLCTGCEACALRSTFTVKDSKDVVGLEWSAGGSQMLAAAADGLSAEFWFKPADLPVLSTMPMLRFLNTADTPSLDIALDKVATGGAVVVRCTYRTKAQDVLPAIDAIGKTAVTKGKWHHVRCAWASKSKTMQLFVDGTQEASVAATVQPTLNNAMLLWGGCVPPVGKEFTGQLDELRIVAGKGMVPGAQFKRRYTANAITQLLIHADESSSLNPKMTAFTDASSLKLTLQQVEYTSKNELVLGKSPLTTAPEDCYGYSLGQAQCTDATPFFCGN